MKSGIWIYWLIIIQERPYLLHYDPKHKKQETRWFLAKLNNLNDLILHTPISNFDLFFKKELKKYFKNI